MKRALWITLAVLVAAGIAWAVGEYGEDAVHVTGQFGQFVLAVRNDVLAALAGADGDYAPLQVDALGALYVTDYRNTRDTALVAVTVDTWTALSGISNSRYLQIVCKNATDGATATLNIWGSDDGGTTFYPMVRADTLAKAKDVAINVGTNFSPTEGASITNSDTVVVAIGPATHIFIDAEAGATAGFTYECGGL